ncbi:MAG: hypothetical protein U0527_09905 [Candidatus Eisenbacteria bacterium]
MSWRALLLLALLGLADRSQATERPKDSPALSRPTLAVEDTIPPLVAEPYPEILVNAPRASLDEILARVAAGEAHRDSLIDDTAFTALMRVVGHEGEGDKARSWVYWDAVARVYRKRPDKVRVIRLKEQAYDENGKPKKDSNVNVDFDADLSEQFIAFAFDPTMRERYRFSIEDRSLVGEHVVYRIAFAPRSALDPFPTGRVWVDTNDFVILREEFWYRDRSPAPFFIERIDNCVLERARVDDRYWVLSRLLARATFSDTIRLLGKVSGEKVPKTCDLSFQQTEWIINGGVPDSLFTPEKKQ